MQQINLLEYLEQDLAQKADKVAFSDGKDCLCFGQLAQQARAIGSRLAALGYYREPVVVFMSRHPHMVAAFLGVLYGGSFYVPLDDEMPRHRIALILETLKPQVMICDAHTESLLAELAFAGQVLRYDEIITTAVDEAALQQIRDHALDTDPAYIVFTSGSTGVPKGVVACHRSVIDYIEQLSAVLHFGPDTVFGNQTPLYFDACLKEIYPTLKFGATTYLIPKALFLSPIKLVEYLNQHQINTICWVVSALTFVSGLGTFEQVLPQYLHTVAFGSEVMPIKQLRLWQKALPQAYFVNLYGPTEGTGMCCYYVVEREFDLDETIPIGKPFRNTEVLLLDAENRLAAPGQVGEMCLRGASVTLGYYRDFARTQEVFVQNPLNQAYPEWIYRTGDLAKRDEQGNLLFVSRKDYQIKHMGHRIELGEIELIANMHDQVTAACATFDPVKKKIVLYYMGEVEQAEIMRYLKEKLPRYMLPSKVRQLARLPLTANGKIDRKRLQEETEKI